MPRNNQHHQSLNGTNPDRPFPNHHTSSETTTQQQQQPPSKPNPRFLYLLLQALIMTFSISLFFIFIGLAAIIFIHLCLSGWAHHRTHRQFRRRPISDDGEISSGYSLESLESIPITKSSGSDICPICLDNLLEGDICRVLPSCKHVFHLNCVDEWLVRVPLCPVCRCSVRSLDKCTAPIDWERLWVACG